MKWSTQSFSASSRALAFTFGLAVVPSSGALACRGVTDWPREPKNENQVKVKALVQEVFVSDTLQPAIMGSDRSMYYRLQVRLSSNVKDVKPGAEILAFAKAHPCESPHPGLVKPLAELSVVLERAPEGGYIIVGGTIPPWN